MYVRIPETRGLSDLPSCKPTDRLYRPPFTKGGQYIRKEDAGKLLTILAGPSPYQEYIRRVMTSKTASAWPKKFLRIVASPKEVPDERLRKRFVTVDNQIVGGTIDRRTGTIYLLELAGIRGYVRGYTRLDLALHEAVHLFSHPFMALAADKTVQSSYGRVCTTETDVGTLHSPQKKYRGQNDFFATHQLTGGDYGYNFYHLQRRRPGLCLCRSGGDCHKSGL